MNWQKISDDEYQAKGRAIGGFYKNESHYRVSRAALGGSWTAQQNGTPIRAFGVVAFYASPSEAQRACEREESKR